MREYCFNVGLRALGLMVLIATAVLPSLGQQKIAGYGNNPEGLLNDQAPIALSLADQLLDAYPPTLGLNSIERQGALMLIDQMTHDDRLDYSLPLADFATSRMLKVLTDLDRPIGDDEMRVYKLYNAGTIVRTNDATVAFDLVRGKLRGSGRAIVTDSLLQRLADRCHIMFLSHRHRDHVDSVVVAMFTDAGKPVVGPADALPINPGILHINPGDTIRSCFVGSNGVSLPVTILPGHQSEMQNLVTTVEMPNGMKVCQTGDQWNLEDTAWVSHAQDFTGKIDVLLLNCWVNDFDRTIAGFAPRLVVLYHENELCHTIGHREPYWLSHRLLEDAPYPAALMGWGEWITLKK